MEREPDIETMLDRENLAGLEEALRWPENDSLRARAARALGELGDGAAAESLALSAWLDPELLVQTASKAGLNVLLGENAARSMLTMYRNQEPDDDDWLRVDPEADELINWTGETGPAWNSSDVSGLISVLRAERDPQLRVRAARALAGFPSPEVVNALIETCLHSDHPHVRAVCREVLIEIYGDDAAEVIERFRSEEDDGEEDDWEDDESEDGSWDVEDKP